MRIGYGVMIFLVALHFKLQAQKPDIVKFDAIEKILQTQNDTVYVLNFWATWCKPCVREIPIFDTAYRAYSGSPVCIILVSLDFISQYETNLIPFIQRTGLAPKVVLLNDIDYNAWIDRVDKKWGGAIPCTLIFNNKNKFRFFTEGEMSWPELKEKIDSAINR